MTGKVKAKKTNNNDEDKNKRSKAFKRKTEIICREFKGGKCVSLIHKGPYDDLHKSYKKIFNYCRDKNYKTLVPSREIHLKGPGMILKGNPKNYLTEIVLMIE